MWCMINMVTLANTVNFDGSLIRLDAVGVHFGRQRVLRDISADGPPRPDVGHYRRKRVRQNGAC